MKEQLVAIIVRHGETGLNKSKCFRSWLDVELNDTGISQAKAVSQFLAKYPIKRVICSPLLRAFVTAVEIANPHGLFVAQHRGLFPWRLGIFSGRSRDEANDALQIFVKNPTVKIPDGESLYDFEERSFAFYKAVLEECRTTKQLTVLVAHTSNVISLNNFTDDANPLDPEFGETIKPGGAAAIYWNGKNHRIETIFGEGKISAFGGA